MYTKKALDLINSFKDSKLDGKIENLQNYSFWGISGNDEYDYTCKEKFSPDFDGDRTKIAYAIDYLLYKDSLPEDFRIPGYPYSSDSDCNYTGETINTFNTLFAKNKYRRNEISKLFKNDWKKIYDEEQKNNPFSEDFYHVYQRIGNFMLQPSMTIDKRSINSYRGYYNKKWKDYFDIFLNNYKNKSDDFLNKLLDKNAFFFEKNNFDDYLDIFFLRSKFYTYENFILNGQHFAYWELNESNIEDFVVFANDYVLKATELINKRSEKIVKELKSKYRELTQ